MKKATPRTGEDVFADIQRSNPGRRFALSTDGNCIGEWSDEADRFVATISHAITGEWVYLPRELLLNGQPPYRPDQWREDHAYAGR